MDQSSKKNIEMIEHHESSFSPDDPVVTPAQAALEKRLLRKLDVLIVGLTSLVFLVNQWVGLPNVFVREHSYLTLIKSDQLVTLVRTEETSRMLE